MNSRKEEQGAGGWRAFFQLIRQTKPSLALLGVSMALSVATTATALVIPQLTRKLVDGFTLESLGIGQILLLAAAFLVQALASGFSIYLFNRVGQQVVAGLRDLLWKKVLVLPVVFYDRNKTGDTMSRVTNDTAIIKGVVSEHLIGFLSGVIAIVGAVAILLATDWKMTLVLLVMIPLLLLVIIPVGRMMFRISKGMQEETASFTSVLSQVLSEIRLVKVSDAEEKEYARGKSGIDNLYRFGLKEGKAQAIAGPVIMLVVMSILVVLIGYGEVRVSSGALTAGGLVAYILYLFQIMFPVTQMANFFTQLQKARGATERIGAILAQEAEDLHAGKTLTRIDKPITLERVSFSYETGKDVLREVGFTVEPGKTTALVGPSGSGKTTIFALLERFYRPVGGAIRLGDEPAEAYSLHSWRSRIGYVTQESPLMSGTVRENICYGLERDVSWEELVRAAEMAYADGFIGELPEGFDTEVGERGVKLSGGQRQRIAIARALLRNPDLLMLDEATSSLDSRSEAAVQKALRNLMRGRTTLVIAHRLSTVVEADQILFVEKGRITGRGRHDELFRTHAMYREFAVQQLRVKENPVETAQAADSGRRIAANEVSLG